MRQYQLKYSNNPSLKGTLKSDIFLSQPSPFPRQHSVLKADSHIACRAHAVPMPRPCRFHAMPMPCPCHALTMPLFSRPRHSTTVQRRPVGYLPAFGFFRLPRGVPRRLLPEAYQSSSQRSIPTTVKSGSSTLQKRRSVKQLD